MFQEMAHVYAVYQEKSFTKAAQKMYISQPALSIMVKRAEERIGTPIFNRSTSPISLTSAGQYYIEQAERIMRIEQETKAYFNLIRPQSECLLTIAGSSYFLSYLIPGIIKLFREQYRKVIVHTRELRSCDMLANILDGSIDFFLEVDDIKDRRIGQVICGAEQVILAVPADWQINEELVPFRFTADDICARRHLSKDSPGVTLEHFESLPFVLLREGNDSFQRAVTLCRKAGFTPKVTMFADQVFTSYNLAAEGHGIAFIRDSLLFSGALTDKLYFYKIADPLALRSIYLYHRCDVPLPTPAQAFLDFIRRENGLFIL